MLPAILSGARSALEREAETRLDFVVLVEYLEANTAEKLGERATQLALTFAFATFGAFVTFRSLCLCFPFRATLCRGVLQSQRASGALSRSFGTAWRPGSGF